MDPKNQPLALPNSLADSNTSRGSLMLPPMVAAAEVPLGPPALTAPPTVSGLLHALRRRWLLATSLALLGGLLGVLAVFEVFPAKYVAHSRTKVAAHADQKLFGPSPHEEDFAIYKANLAAMIKSPVVVSAALNDAKDPALARYQGSAASLETALKTDYLLAPEVLRLSLAGDDPEEVTKIVNAVTDAFLKELEQKEKVKRQLHLDELNQNYRATLNVLDQKRRALRTRLRSEHLKDPATLLADYQNALSNLAMARKTMLDKKLEQIGAEQDFKSIEEQLQKPEKIPVPALQLEDLLKRHPVAEKIYLDMADTHRKIELTRASARPTAVQQLTASDVAHLANLEKSLNVLREQLRPQLELKARQDLASKMQGQAIDFKSRIQSLTKQQESLGVEVEKLQAEAQKLNPAHSAYPLDVMALQDDITRMETGLNRLGETIAGVKVEPVLGARVSLLQRAEVPGAKDASRQVKLAGVAGLGLAGLLLFGVGWLEFRARRITAADEVVHGLNMNLVGTLPALPPVSRGPVPAGTSPKDLYWQSQLNESVDSIRTMLLHAARTESLHVVLVTSAMEGEGKSSVASQLAASLARAWRKTLLVDADLRKPALHQILGVPQEPGLSEVLRGEVKPEDVIRPTALSRLWLMPAGHCDAHTLQALAQDGVHDMFHKLKEQYDYIIVDSSPVLPVADSLLLAQHVEGVIFSILRDVSRVPSVYGAQQRLVKLGVRVLGAVVIGDRAHVPSLAYPYQARAGAAAQV